MLGLKLCTLSVQVQAIAFECFKLCFGFPNVKWQASRALKLNEYTLKAAVWLPRQSKTIRIIDVVIVCK